MAALERPHHNRPGIASRLFDHDGRGWPRGALVGAGGPVRAAVARALERGGVAVTGFADYPEPALFLAAAPDLAVLDVMLPSGDGFELARRLRAARDLPAPPGPPRLLPDGSAPARPLPCRRPRPARSRFELV